MESDSSKFLKELPVPEKFEEKQIRIQNFVQRQHTLKNKVVLVTSGGTIVPLESRTVRFIDNFSQGTRGSASAEYFLNSGYAVIFLHRNGSLEPYSRNFSRKNLLDFLEFREDGQTQSLAVQGKYEEKISKILRIYQKVTLSEMLLSVDFTTLSEYLYLLRIAALALKTLHLNAMLYLAAAVSDFYIPKDQMPEHKIQSSNGSLQLSLQLVPKLLEPLVKDWAPDAFIISFKLETNRSLLISKSKAALEKYQHQLVIANLLETRKEEVILVTKDSSKPIMLSAECLSQGIEIEELIIKELIARHNEMLNNK
ncbi:phosphopantothenate--cysteine ligase [Octopus bimaculoides]|uniref:Phosphopantothenate--cysteine ligase n=1 Tax=Octopus bimaculoides TaxID=37653 RepID=A0A0L8HNF8_OCTBM|nr:phosphopantothenate--cysteine ligase [Octopus bimaculoides]|eukprot:XP_014770869.1 PREDICTED: phosphopantothenate--cysteine ligase-like [Octopus bimaculoides]